ncbi:DUF1592 domain-containing protein [Lacipirellula limnantheis]|uniref:Planctomycete cytochrome C n=1 Tax=Lacipirellula limnantheis TaxID=2528024 RepID=A0A517TZA4_9BACT|nr:DUF1592 domain-containing protein [Lacipirellula limnantheis]QDT73708.1 hypothetical protein I41_28990 [Lacipirellula limnantheis]
MAAPWAHRVGRPLVGPLAALAFSLSNALWWTTESALAAAPSDLPTRYESTIQPLLAQYCHDCHNADLAEGDLDFSRLSTWAAAETETQQWKLADEMIHGGIMPPVDAPQPTDGDRAAILEWLHDYLTLQSKKDAGDPGPVVLRRLCNAEYAYTVRDLTGVGSLDPGREFPVDGAAGEGFTNVGNALAMSPALATKYLDAAKEIAAHAVLLPDGIGFSPKTTRSDWTAERLAAIRRLYAKYADAGGGDQVNVQGVIFKSNEGGRLPVEKYFAALIDHRDALTTGSVTLAEVAAQGNLSPKYLGALWSALTAEDPSLLLDEIRGPWRSAQAGDPPTVASLAALIHRWQEKLWKFNIVGHIGKVGGPRSWQEAVSPLTSRHEIRRQLVAQPGADEVVFSLITSAAGDNAEHDVAVWNRPRLAIPGRADLPLRDVRQTVAQMEQRRQRIAATTSACLAAAAEAEALAGSVDLAELAKRHAVDAADLQAWLDYLGIGLIQPIGVTGHLSAKLENVGGYPAAAGWKGAEFPQFVANSSDQELHIPGLLPPRNFVVHPGPTARATLVWQAPVAGRMVVTAAVTHAHPACGNGVTWRLEHLRGRVRQRLAAGIAQGSAANNVSVPEPLDVQLGDQLILTIGPRDGDHSCDLTNINLTIFNEANAAERWNLAEDVAADVTAGNPHADRLGHANVWHFTAEAEIPDDSTNLIPSGSLVERWRAAASDDERGALAAQLAALLASREGPAGDSPDAVLFRDLTAWRGPLLGGASHSKTAQPTAPAEGSNTASVIGLDPAAFGRAPNGEPIDAESLAVNALSVIEVRLPAALASNCEFVVEGTLHPELGREGSVQFDVVMGAAGSDAVQARVATLARPASDSPIVTTESSAARSKLEGEVEAFRQLFPAALCYATIVPVDEAVTLTLYHREDDQLSRLMLSDAERAELDRLWNELHFISQDAFTKVDALAQLIEYATQDADPSAFLPLREPYDAQAAAFRRQLLAAEPQHVNAVVEFAARAYRRPLTAAESAQLRELYAKFRTEELDHEAATRLLVARLFASPAFLYRLESPATGQGSAPVSDWELATRLSYFLWSSTPDETLRALAAAGQLSEPPILVEQLHRMLADDRISRLSSEFACQWLHVRDFAAHDEKSETHFPAFAALRGAMAEESRLFFTDLFQHDRSVLSILDADHTFLNDALAVHYEIPNVTGPQWRRVDGVRQFGRGGILSHATTLAANSGASRTSPILRGVWISEVLLGERLPKPPAGVPPLPDEQSASDDLTVRQQVERHVSDPKCAGCHRRIDPYGFALEAYDAIGRRRSTDLNGQPIDARSELIDSTKVDGVDGLRNYLVETRRSAFVRQFCKKLLGFALGRGVLLTDEPLLADMEAALAANDYRVSAAIEVIVLSRQFREIRGVDATAGN